MRLFVFVVTLIGLSGCQTATQKTHSIDYYNHILDPQARFILEKAINWSGGIEKWKSLDSIVYIKGSKLFLEDGSIESTSIELHQYAMKPVFSAQIDWKNDGKNHKITYSPEKAQQFINDSLIRTSGEKAERKIMSAIYALGMPFKLLDKGTQLSYVGKTKIKGTPADAIYASYRPDSYENHSASDLWWYYFHETTGEFLGCLVYHAPTYAFIENDSFYDINGIKFHAHRKSFRTDSMRKKAFLRGGFWYSNYATKSTSQ